jgi:hypothetical protein
MKSKEELMGDYREMVEHNALQKDIVFLEVLIDIREALVAGSDRRPAATHAGSIVTVNATTG